MFLRTPCTILAQWLDCALNGAFGRFCDRAAHGIREDVHAPVLLVCCSIVSFLRWSVEGS